MRSSLESAAVPNRLQGVLAATASDDQLTWRWPSAPLLSGLQEVELLEIWLQRQLDRHLEELWQQRIRAGSLQPAVSLQEHCFGAQASSLFLQQRHRLDQVLLSVLQLDDSQLAQEVWFRLQAREMDFDQLSHHGIGPERELGGRLGPIALQDLDPNLRPLLRRLEPGELATPLQNPDGSVLLLRLEERWPARFDDRTRQQLEQELYSAWRDAQLRPLLQHPPTPGSLVTLQLPWLR